MQSILELIHMIHMMMNPTVHQKRPQNDIGDTARRAKMRYVVVAGGALSELGKGSALSAIASLLQAAGLKAPL